MPPLDDQEQGVPDYEEPIDVADDAPVSDEENARLIAEYGLDELADDEVLEEEAAPAAEESQAGDDVAPPADEPEAAAADDPAEPPVDEPEDPEPDADAPPPAAEAQPDDAAPPDDGVEPWEFQVDGQKIKPAGAIVFNAQLPDGTQTRMIAVPETTWNRELRPYVAHRATFRRQQMELLRQLEAEKAARQHDPKILQSEKIIELLEYGATLTDEDEILEWQRGFREKRKEWERQAEIVARDEQIAAMKNVTPPPDEVLDQLQREDLEEAITQTVAEAAAGLMAEPEFAAVAPYLPMDEVVEELREQHDRFLRIAKYRELPAETVEKLKAAGVEDGQPFIDFDYMRRWFRNNTQRIQRVRQSLEQRRRVEEDNARRLGKGKKPNGTKPEQQPAPRPAARNDEETDYDTWKRDFLGDVSGPVIVD